MEKFRTKHQEPVSLKQAPTSFFDAKWSVQLLFLFLQEAPPNSKAEVVGFSQTQMALIGISRETRPTKPHKNLP